MIKFALVCQGGHEFESWFQNGSAFDAQLQAQLLECPHCQTIKISKAIMAPAVSKGRAKPDVPAQATSPQSRGTAQPALPRRRTLLRRPFTTGLCSTSKAANSAKWWLRSIKNCNRMRSMWVPISWRKKARRIHDGKAEQRLILGQATFEDAQALLEEGINIMPVPPLPEDFN